ncbi:MAG: ABC transporter permease [Nocardioides sp.]|uniref:ABC transporter permease n=1 Tax=Nocardioides sp. TaxID=35761 RepID=UPI0039E64AD6
MSFWDYLNSRSPELQESAWGHIEVTAAALGIAIVLGIGLGILGHLAAWTRGVLVGLFVILFTVPPLALLSLLIAPVGLGFRPSVIALVMYSVLPILRNTLVGLGSVPASLTDAGVGMGMSRLELLFLVQLPVAWPIVIGGVRVGAQIAISVAAVAAYIGCPGFGNQIFEGLARFGAVNSFNAALAGTLGVVLVAVLFDVVIAGVGRLAAPERVFK